MGMEDAGLTCGAVCVYPNRVAECVQALKRTSTRANKQTNKQRNKQTKNKQTNIRLDLTQVQGRRHPSGSSSHWFSKRPNASNHQASGDRSFYLLSHKVNFVFCWNCNGFIFLMKPWLSSQRAGDQNGCGGWSKGDRYCYQQVFNKAQNPPMVWTTEPSSLCGSEIVIENWSKKYGSENHNILQTVGLGTALDRTVWGGEADEGEDFHLNPKDGSWSILDQAACGSAHMKSILAIGELGSMTNVYKVYWH